MKEEKYLKKLFAQGKKETVLTREEKEAMRSSLLNFMKDHPLEEAKMPSRQMGWFASFNFKNPALKYASIISVFALVLLYGISFSASNSLPGDLLYPIKVGVNEKVLGLLLVSDESKAQYDIQLVETRLEELERVSSKENLDENTKANISSLLNKHIENAQKHSLNIENKDNPEISLKINSELEASLNAHKEILDELSKEKDSKASENIRGVLLNVNEKINKVKKDRKESEDALSNKSSADVQQSAEGKLKSAENRIEEVSKFVDDKKSSISEESYNTAKENIKLANDTILQGQAELQAGNYNKAFSLFQKAIRIAQQTKISVHASINLGINVFEIKDKNGDKDHDEDKEGDEEDSANINSDFIVKEINH